MGGPGGVAGRHGLPGVLPAGEGAWPWRQALAWPMRQHPRGLSPTDRQGLTVVDTVLTCPGPGPALSVQAAWPQEVTQHPRSPMLIGKRSQHTHSPTLHPWLV